MASAIICLFLLGSLHAVHAAADSEKATKYGKLMSKAFVPARTMPRPASTVNQDPAAMIGQSNPSLRSAMVKTLIDLETQTQEMKVEYQRLQARVQELRQGDVEGSVDSSASFGWFAALIASIGATASIGVVAIRKYFAQGQQGSETTTVSQIPLMPQMPLRTGPIVATATDPSSAPDATTSPWSSRRSIVSTGLAAGLTGLAGAAFADDDAIARIAAQANAAAKQDAIDKAAKEENPEEEGTDPKLLVGGAVAASVALSVPFYFQNVSRLGTKIASGGKKSGYETKSGNKRR